MSDSIEDLLNEAYSTTHDMLRNPELDSIVRHGLLISYGPPIPEPDLLLLSFQGGGGDPEVQKTWPQKLRYLDSPRNFGTALRGLCRETGLYSSLQSSAMAFPTVFPQAPSEDAGRWEKGSGSYSEWRDHSTRWVRRLVKVIKPKAVMVFGAGRRECSTFGGRMLSATMEGAIRHSGPLRFRALPPYSAITCPRAMSSPKL